MTTRIRFRRLSNAPLLTLLLLLAAGVFAVTAQSGKWEAFSTDNKEFGAAIPPGGILINVDRSFPRIILSTADVRVEVTRRKNNGEPDSALATRAAPRDRGSETEFELSGVVGHVNVSERPNRYATVIHASSKKYSYFISVYARMKDAPVAKQFLASLNFGGKPLFTIDGVAPPVGTSQKLESMPSSEIVTRYLDIPNNKKAPVRFAPVDATIKVFRGQAEESDIESSVETRSLIILRMPLPTYRVAGARGSGTAPVTVTLLSSGQVGEVVIDPSVDRDFAESAADAAKQIKFIPAEVDGKPVDVKRTFVYAYTSR